MKKVIVLLVGALVVGSFDESEAAVVVSTHYSFAKPKVYQKKQGFFSFLKRKKKCKCPPLPS
jgi:hypothetical protein